MRLKSAPSKRALAENTITLINIVFLMLIFFLIMGTVSTPLSKKVNPAETSLLPLVPPHPNVIEIDEEGKIYYRKQYISVNQLANSLSGGPDKGDDIKAPVKLAADKNLQADHLIEILEVLKEAGINKVRLVTVNGVTSQ